MHQVRFAANYNLGGTSIHIHKERFFLNFNAGFTSTGVSGTKIALSFLYPIGYSTLEEQNEDKN